MVLACVHKQVGRYLNLLVHIFKETMTNHWNLLGKKQLTLHPDPIMKKNPTGSKHFNSHQQVFLTRKQILRKTFQWGLWG